MLVSGGRRRCCWPRRKTRTELLVILIILNLTALSLPLFPFLSFTASPSVAALSCCSPLFDTKLPGSDCRVIQKLQKPVVCRRPPLLSTAEPLFPTSSHSTCLF